MIKIFCFGSEFKNDDVAFKLSKILQKKNKNINFIIANSPTDILNAKDDIIILDVVKGIKEVKLITDTNKLELCNSVTCHDLDLGFYLKLLKETGKINNVKIIGLPYGNTDYKYLEEKVNLIIKEGFQ